jgi:hypothetical protein
MVNAMHGPTDRCPVCGFADIRAFISISQVPVYCNLLWATREAAVAVPKGDIDLGFCRNCGYIYNMAFDRELMGYTQAYENSLHFSPRFQAYAEELAARLVERYGLYRKEIIEIGSGQGDFLRLLCDLGGNRGLGFDPSYVPEATRDATAGRVSFIQDYYSERYASYEADLICCRHTLEHIENPVTFLSTVRRAIGSRTDTAVFFEVPNMAFTLRDLGIWDLIYEHCSYFVELSLACAFVRSGFRIGTISEAFGGQFLGIEASPGQAGDCSEVDLGEGLARLGEDVAVFGERYQRKVESWRHRLAGHEAEDHRVVVWGAGSKGVTFLNVVQAHGRIDYVVDINPRKRGMYVAGTGQKIVPPDELRDYAPDVVVIMNPVYQHEIRQMMEGLGLEAELLCA